MKTKFILFFSLIIFISVTSNLAAQDSTKSTEKKIEHGQNFVDEDGDGYNDNAPDHDGDGIPNGLDPDWLKLKKEKNKAKHRFVDRDGDGIDDNLQTAERPGQNGMKPLEENRSGSGEGNSNQQKGARHQHGKK